MKKQIKYILLMITIFTIIFTSSVFTADVDERISISDAHCYPNPFKNQNEVTKIKFTIETEKDVNSIGGAIVIYTYTGKKVWTKRLSGISATKGKTETEVIWGGENDLGEKVPNGLYYAKIILEGPNTKIAVVKILVK